MKIVKQTLLLTVLLASSVALAQDVTEGKERRERPPRGQFGGKKHEGFKEQLSDEDFQKVQECHAQQNVDFPPKEGSVRPEKAVMDKIHACLKNYNVQMPRPPRHRHEDEDFQDRNVSNSVEINTAAESSSSEGTAQ